MFGQLIFVYLLPGRPDADTFYSTLQQINTQKIEIRKEEILVFRFDFPISIVEWTLIKARWKAVAMH